MFFKVVAETLSGVLRSFKLVDPKVHHNAHFKFCSMQMIGSSHRLEFLDRGKDAVMVLPVDWERRVVYFVSQARPIMQLSEPEGRGKLAALYRGEIESFEMECQGESVNTIDVPAGMIDPEDVDAAEAGLREVLEETGLVLVRSDLRYVCRHWTSSGASTERHFCYLAEVTSNHERRRPKGDGDERIQTLECTLEDAYAMLANDAVAHASMGRLLEHVKGLDWKRQSDEQIAELKRLVAAKDERIKALEGQLAQS